MRGKPKPDRKRKPSRTKAEEKQHLNDLLDQGLKETFPASDTPVVIRPGHGIPHDSDDRET